MNKIFYFLMVGFAFTVLQVGTVEAVKDCSDFKPGTPPFDSCVADNQKTAGEAGIKAPATSGTDCANAGDPTEVAACWDRQAPSAEATGMVAPGTAPMEDSAAAPSMKERVKSFFGMGNDTPVPPTPGAAGMGAPETTGMGAPETTGMGAPGTAGMGAPETTGMGAPGTAGMGAPGTAGMGAPGTAGMGAPGTASTGDPSCAPLANGTLPPHCK
jgi:hypothetical protein